MHQLFSKASSIVALLLSTQNQKSLAVTKHLYFVSNTVLHTIIV